MTKDDNIRFCELCSENVYLCHTPEEVKEKAEEKKCEAYVKYDIYPPMVGVPDGSYQP